ncbi:NAD(P)-dependent malic enzyme [Fodinicola acaciae]|uniref:NAD(P)-dependent malic enzyme n=1 Tax=Fodinicola acaciae TaxID=2681555 RepID=UPI0013D0A650|nr:NADP-dependent malic enzyme [Fodinicola acaciae]
MVAEPLTSPSTLDDDPIFALHRGGKMAVTLTAPLTDRDDLSMAYTPGVAQVCRAIAAEPSLFDSYTWATRAVAVVTDGTAVLGLGDIGPQAAMPVMEGKAVLFKRFGGVDAVPLCLATSDPDEIVAAVKAVAPSFGGINLEDISAPRCFDIEERLTAELDIPVFHDDQHGTAIVVLAALRGASRLTNRSLDSLRIVIAGAGAAGVAVARILLAAGAHHVVVTDSKGILHTSRPDLNPVKAALAEDTNPDGMEGELSDALAGADVFLGLSGGTVPEEDVARMAPGAYIFAMANPDPEIQPDIAYRYASVVATGRSDYPNQINNVLAFPGVFRGALACRASRITEAMKLAAAEALAGLVADELRPDYIIPSVFDERVGPAVAAAVAAAARAEGVARA